MKTDVMKLEEAKRIHDELFNAKDYQNCLVMWRRIQQYQIPFLGELDGRDKMIKRDAGIIDGTAWRAAQIFAGGMTNGSVPQTVEWFDLQSHFAEDDQTLKAILQDQRDTINKALNASNFYSSIYSANLELSFGQSPRGSFFIPERGMVFENYSIGSYAYALDPWQEVTHFAVKKEMSLSKIVSKFGLEALPEKQQQEYKDGKNSGRLMKVYWLMTKNPAYDNKALGPKGKRYVSLYWLDCSDKEFIHVGGFETCPITIMRYLAIPNSDYGIGPGWFADSDNRVMFDLLKAAAGNMELFYNPALQVPTGTDPDYRPGAITEVDMQLGKVQSLFDIAPVFDKVYEMAAIREDKINAAYNTNLFAMLEQQKFDNTGRTAYEWSLRQQEKMQQLTPVVTRINTEVLSRDIKRVYGIYTQNGVFEMPPEYDGMELEIEYVSPLAKLQRMSGVQDYESALAAIGQTAQLKPGVVNMLNESVFLRKWIDDLGVKSEILYTDEEYAEIQQQQAQAAQQQEQMQEDMAVAQALPNVTQAAANLQEMADNGSVAPLDNLLSSLRGGV